MSGLNGTPGERMYSKRVPRVRIPASPPRRKWSGREKVLIEASLKIQRNPS